MKDISCSRSVTLIITKGGKWKVSVNGVEIILTKSSFCRTAGTCMQRPATSSIVFIFKIKSNQKISLHLHSWSSYVYSFCFKKWGKVQALFISIHCYILVDRWRWNNVFHTYALRTVDMITISSLLWFKLIQDWNHHIDSIWHRVFIYSNSSVRISF